MVDKESFLSKMKTKAMSMADSKPVDHDASNSAGPSPSGEATADGQEDGNDSDLKHCIADMKSLLAKMEKYC